MTYDGSNSAYGIKLYIDGVEWPVHTRYNTPMTGTMKSASPVRLGYSEVTDYIGWQDETSVWNKELTQADVTELFNGGDPDDLSTHTSVDNLIGWWRMGEGANDATMVAMEAGDLVEDTPYVQTGGGSDLTARALADDEIAGDMLGEASVDADASLNHGAEAVIAADSAIAANILVRPQLTPLPIPAEPVVPVVERLIGFQPGRETPPQKDQASIMTDTEKLRELNRNAPRRRPSIIRKDTGVSAVEGGGQGSDHGES